MGTYSNRQYESLSAEQRRTRDSKVAFVWIAFVALLLFVLFGWIWLAQGNTVHHLFPFGLVLLVMTIILFVAWKLATEVPVKGDSEERMFTVVGYCFGVVLVLGLLPMLAVLLSVGFAGGS
jgi:hypothetical protein